MADNTNDSLARPDRRAFVKKVVAGSAIAIPVVATFSLGSVLSDAQQSASSASAGTSSQSQTGSSGNPCQADPGYIGPGRFAAHLVYAGNPGDVGARINGEIHFLVDEDKGDDDKGKGKGKDSNKKPKHPGPLVHTGLSLTGESNGSVVFGSASLLINSVYAVSLNDGASDFDASDVAAGFCDLDFVLNAMAGGQASVLVSVNFLGQQIQLTGPVAAAGPGFAFVNLNG